MWWNGQTFGRATKHRRQSCMRTRSTRIIRKRSRLEFLSGLWLLTQMFSLKTLNANAWPVLQFNACFAEASHSDQNFFVALDAEIVSAIYRKRDHILKSSPAKVINIFGRQVRGHLIIELCDTCSTANLLSQGSQTTRPLFSSSSVFGTSNLFRDSWVPQDGRWSFGQKSLFCTIMVMWKGRNQKPSNNRVSSILSARFFGSIERL